MTKIKSILCVTLVAVSCERGDPGPGAGDGAAEGFSIALVREGVAATVDACPNGGVELQSGVDVNRNGLLDPEEVANTYPVCNGADGATSAFDLLSCAAGQVPQWSGSAWTCADASGQDSLSKLACAPGQVARWNGSVWGCANSVETDTWAGLSCVAGQVPVKASGGWTCGTGSGADTLSNLSCDQGQHAMWNGSVWACSSMTETDPVFAASASASITSGDRASWSAAYGWGNHALQGYLTGEADPVFSSSAAGSITGAEMAKWSAAYGWGDHASQGYLKTEADPLFAASVAASVTRDDRENWSAAYGWGNHAFQGYLTSETDPVFSSSAAGSITGTDMARWGSAFGWGDHASQGYLKTETDPHVGALVEGGWCSAQSGRVTCDQSLPAHSLGATLAAGNDAGGSRIKNVAAPLDAGDAATKAYVDAAMAGALPAPTIALCCGYGCDSAFVGWTCFDAPESVSFPRGEDAALEIWSDWAYWRVAAGSTSVLNCIGGVLKVCATQTVTEMYATCAVNASPVVLPGYQCTRMTMNTVVSVPDRMLYRFQPAAADTDRLASFGSDGAVRRVTCPVSTTPLEYGCWR